MNANADDQLEAWNQDGHRARASRRHLRMHQGASEPSSMKLSIVMPAYNEERTIAPAVSQVLQSQMPCPYELIIVDDGSTDRTAEILSHLNHPNARVVRHPTNLGKGAALQTGAAVASGTHFVPFDADLEYDPDDLALLMVPVLQGRCDVVYGVRLSGANTRYQSYRHALGNRLLTLVASLMFDAALSDIHTCLKLIPLSLFREMNLSEDGFGLDTEITAKLLKRDINPFEIPVSYHSRSIAGGKKITWRDGVECLRVLARVRATARPEMLSVDAHGADPLDNLASSLFALSQLTGVPEVSDSVRDAQSPVG